MARPTRDRVMRRCKFIALLGGVLLAGGALLIIASFAQGIGRWIISTPMPSSRTEVAVAEVGGKIYVVGGFGGERELEVYDPGQPRLRCVSDCCAQHLHDDPSGIGNRSCRKT